MGNTKLFRFARTGLNLPQVILDQVASYETEIDNSAQFVEKNIAWNRKLSVRLLNSTRPIAISA